MTVKIGSRGRIEVFEDFLAFTVATMGTTALPQGDIMYCSVNEGSFATTVDEPGGILACVTDTADNDNIALYSGPFKAADGGCQMEARYKVASIATPALFCGFSELLNATTPVCPIEANGANVLTMSSSGAAAGILFDIDQTTDTFLAVAADNSAASTGAPVNTGLSPTNNEWEVTRVEVDPDGTARVYHAEDNSGLKLQATFSTALTTTVVLFPCLLCENRSGAANTMEVDYFYAKGFRDWTD